jgi:hypothetical protein
VRSGRTTWRSPRDPLLSGYRDPQEDYEYRRQCRKYGKYDAPMHSRPNANREIVGGILLAVIVMILTARVGLP